MKYNAEDADAFWSRRVRETDQLAAVLNYGVPKIVNEAHSRWELACVMDALPDVCGRRVLDLACGIGRFTVPLARMSAYVTAVDNARGMIESCRENVENAGLSGRVTFQQARSASLPFEDETFDVVLCMGLLEHLPEGERQGTLDELVRVTCGGGTILVSANNADSVFLTRRSADSDVEQHRDGPLKGFFSGLVGKDWVVDIFEGRGLKTKIAGTNTFQSFAIHLLRKIRSFDEEENLWATLFETCSKLDERYPEKETLDALCADQYVIRAVKP